MSSSLPELRNSLMLRDGTKMRIENGLVMWQRDRNGNKLTYGYDGSTRIQTITDSLNRQIKQANACINFVNNHVYHFAPIAFAFSQSHIAVLEDGKLKVFKSINCTKSKDRLEHVIAYVKKRFEKAPKKDELIARIRDYKKHAVYYNIDSTRRSVNIRNSRLTSRRVLRVRVAPAR